MNTFRGNLQFTTLGDLDRLCRLVSRTLGDVLDSVDHLVTLKDLAKDNVAAIEPRGNNGGDEELGTVRVYVRLVTGCPCTRRASVPFPELAMPANVSERSLVSWGM